MLNLRPRRLAGSIALVVAGALALTGALRALRGAASGHPSTSARVILTSADLRRHLTVSRRAPFLASPPSGLSVIRVDEHRRYQHVRGVGGAMTDTSAWLIYHALPAPTRARLLRALFGPSGIRLSFLRVPMGASDFTHLGHPYSYDDLPRGRTDPRLVHFSIGHDVAYILPALRAAAAMNRHLFIVANPWSPPGWMKNTGSMGNPGDDSWLRPRFYGALARYFVKFLSAYQRAGISVNAVTPQNEPGQNSVYPGLGMTAAEEAWFISHHLAPALTLAGLPTRIYGYDWDWASSQTPVALALLRSPAVHDLTGLATHCYYGSPTTMSSFHRLIPRLVQIVNECSPGIMPYGAAQLEIAAMRNWASAVNLWNLALDPHGGPVQAPNYGCPHCTGIVTVDPHSHRVSYTRDFYELGQLSRYVQPGAVRIYSNNFVTYGYPGYARGLSSAGLDDVAFENPDGGRVLVAYDNATGPVSFAVQDGRRYFSYTLAAGETGTFLWR